MLLVHRWVRVLCMDTRTVLVCWETCVRCLRGLSRWRTLFSKLLSWSRPALAPVSPCNVCLPCPWRPRTLVVLLTNVWRLDGLVPRTVLNCFRFMTIRTRRLRLALERSLRTLSRWYRELPTVHLELLPWKTAWDTAILAQLTLSARLEPLTARSIRVWFNGG